MVRDKKQSLSPPVPETLSLCSEILDWAPSYSFSIGQGLHKEGDYWESANLDLTARILSPKKLRDKVIKFCVLGDRQKDQALEHPEEHQTNPLGVGSLTIRGERCEYLGSMPMSTLWGLIPALENKRLKLITLHGEKLRYGSAKIWSMGFEHEVDPDDYE